MSLAEDFVVLAFTPWFQRHWEWTFPFGQNYQDNLIFSIRLSDPSTLYENNTLPPRLYHTGKLREWGAAEVLIYNSLFLSSLFCSFGFITNHQSIDIPLSYYSSFVIIFYIWYSKCSHLAFLQEKSILALPCFWNLPIIFQSH